MLTESNVSGVSLANLNSNVKQDGIVELSKPEKR